MMNRLSWNTIRSTYAGQWVELTDTVWSWNSPYPRIANVRHHDLDRSRLLAKIKSDVPLSNSIILHVNLQHRIVQVHQDAAVI